MTQWRVPDFEEVRELGRGAQGRVVLARHAARGTPVAIKYLAAGADPAAREGFRAEARMLGRVTDPNVARLYRLVEHGEDLAIVMEAVDGVPFKEILRRYESLEPEAALTVLKGSLLGLAAAHAAGVVHRDYKPANVIVPSDGRSKLVDFGIAVFEGASSAAGTPLYMAPEQWRGEPATPATDVYAATCVFYEALTGRRPYGEGDRASIMAGHLNGAVPAEDVPEPLRPLITRGMAKDAAERPVSAAAFVGQLEELAQVVCGADWEARGVRALAGAAMALAALFPLGAAGLVPAAAAGGGAAAGTAAGTGGVVAAVGTKASVAIAATAVAGASVGGAAVYRATEPDQTTHRTVAAAPASPTLSGVLLKIGPLTIRAPAAWKTHPVPRSAFDTDTPQKPDTYYVSTWTTPCKKENALEASLYPGQSWCPGIHLLGPSFFTDLGAYIADKYSRSNTYASLFHQDEGMSCPRHDELRAVGVERGAVKTADRLAPVGAKKAEYREWRVPCYTREKTSQDVDGYGPTRRTSTTYTERLWYLPQSKILIVDIWDTPNLAQILANATWTT
ncbi:serine/threonine-protein kinase [Actinomadura sp. NTSP31]|uniref:serine/threonine-protein kinase n=1 Tax=Actinomadura sp. NTSP31 TaxID=1735447 RepID=UPI0035C23E7D